MTRMSPSAAAAMISVANTNVITATVGILSFSYSAQKFSDGSGVTHCTDSNLVDCAVGLS
jgi:hypothetical protein